MNVARTLAGMESRWVALKHSQLTDKIIGVFYDVYNELGHGFLESTYREAMALALTESGLANAREVPVPVWVPGREVGQYFAVLVVDSHVLLELQASLTPESAHQTQRLRYLKSTEIAVGLLFNSVPRP